MVSRSMPSTLNFLGYDDNLIVACEDVLKAHWHKGKNLKITRKPKDKSLSKFYCLIDPHQTKGVLHESRANEKLPLPVVPIHPFIVPNSFYFGIRLRFDHEYESTFALTSASVSIFSGQELSPIVRAEWDRRDIGKSRHAQPHWHLLGLTFQDAPRQPFSLGGIDGEPKEFSASVASPRTEVERIHFATSAAWEEGNPTTTQHPFAEKRQLTNWLGGMADYMLEQLTLVASKAPAMPSSSPALKDFHPGQ